MSEFQTSSESVGPPRYSDAELVQISGVFHQLGLPIPVDELRQFDQFQIQRFYVRHMKDMERDFEAHGPNVFGESWQADRWI